MRWSIRWRLTLWNTLVLAVLLLGFSGLVCAMLLVTHADPAVAAHEMDELGSVLGVAIPFALVASGGLAYFLAGRALAPVERVTRATREITADRLDRRLPVRNPDDELGRLTETINTMVARLERSFAEVRRFTADASHELRTPVSVIRAEAEVALGKPLRPDEMQQLLGSILEECERLTRLTDQLLALARQDAGQAARQRGPVPLGELLGDVVETLRPLGEVKALSLRFSPDGMADAVVHGDACLLRQVFVNLLDNAIKYTPEGSTAEILLMADGLSAVVQVRDTGEGIPPEHLLRVFDRFYRVDKARSRAQGGSGLGLSIARGIVEAHGGRIELASTPGEGTTCTVVLPREPGRPAA